MNGQTKNASHILKKNVQFYGKINLLKYKIWINKCLIEFG